MRRTFLLAPVLALAAGALAAPAHAVEVFGCQVSRDTVGSASCSYPAVTTQGFLTLSNASGDTEAWALCGFVQDGAFFVATRSTEGTTTFGQTPGELCYIFVHVHTAGGYATAAGGNDF
ncbi:MAG: hypothetical protein QOE45_2736 [Frankiaceae bacterium]|jgi:hypothetical protein|nr:hypothetical protein [Frankiaceae bacterium]